MAEEEKRSIWEKAGRAYGWGKDKATKGAKIAGRKAMEGGRWAAKTAFEEFKKSNKPQRKKSKSRKGNKAAGQHSKRRIVIEDF